MTATSNRAVRRICFALCACLLGWLVPQSASASFHLWRIQELYSNADGNVQYLELFTTGAAETQTNSRQITITSNGPNGATSHTFTFDRNLTGTTANRTLLIATPGYDALTCAPEADFLFTQNRVFDPAATTITVTLPFADPIDVITFTGVPTDGTNSVNRSDVEGASTPANQAGTSGTLGDCDDATFCNGAGVCANGICGPITTSPCGAQELCDETANSCVECLIVTDCPDDGNPCTDPVCTAGDCSTQNNTDGCDDGNFCTVTDTCGGGACTGSGSPCSGLTPMCDEAGDACAECLVDADCDDGEPCTDDDCAAGACTNTNNTAACDDGLFCTAPDTCSGGSCSGGGNPCGGAQPVCDETGNACVECTGAGDCDDALYCNGTESCAAGACQDGSAPCSGLCVEASDSCVDCTADWECDDLNVCTADDCDGNGDCVRTPVADGTSCTDDGLFCTGAESCSAGACTAAGDPCDPADELCDDVADECVRRCANGDPAVANMCPEDVDPGADDAGAVADASVDAGADASVDAGAEDGGGAGESGAGGRPGRDAGMSGGAGSSGGARDASMADASDSDAGGSSGCDCRIASTTAGGTSGARGAGAWLLLAAAAAIRLVRRRRTRAREIGSA